MSDLTPPLGLAEYTALRATVRERGTLRLMVILLTFLSWGSIVVLTLTLGPGRALAVVSLVTLVVLAAGFEVVFAAHTAVERIGRYLQVRYETPPAGAPAWETMAMDLGRQTPRLEARPLAWQLFLTATALNAVTPWLQMNAGLGQPGGLAVVALAHAVFVVRVLRARASAASQRERDLASMSAWIASHQAN